MDKFEKIIKKFDYHILFKNLGISLFSKTKEKIFVLSFQRTGTTSTGDYFRVLGYKVASQSISNREHWSRKWFDGTFNEIFDSTAFKYHEVFEDQPWWYTDFYTHLDKKYPKAKFILFTRNTDQWFSSMISLTGLNGHKGYTPGYADIHAKLYNRERELGRSLVSINGVGKLLLNETHRGHYTDIYNSRNQDILDYFKQKPNFIHLRLEDENKWNLLGEFIGVKREVNIHSNKSNKF